jgi:SAM-dependent methyltransferase
MDDIYNNQDYLKKNPHWHQEDSAFKAGFIHSILEKNKITYNSVCEVGCGAGEILVQLKQLNGSKAIAYSGYDISRDAIALAQKKNSRIDFKCADITKENVSVDVMLIIDVIEHLRDYFSFLDDLSKKSKYTVFHIPLDMFVWSLFREQMLIESKERVGHIHNFSEDFIVSILKDHGYNIISKEYTAPDNSASSFKQKIKNTMRSVLFKIAPRFTTKTMGGYSLLVLCGNS